ncbi:MAG: hypothetical protein IJD93_08455 [Ruminococcus sp.]|nr:hypothetical protein [Ruminococcus sp.]
MKIEKDKIQKQFKSEKTRNVIIIAGLACLALLFISTVFDKQEAVDTDNLSTDNYQAVLSSEILSMVTSVEGAGEAKVLLTLENSYEYIYLDDGRTLQKINEPTVRGVVVACKGADSAMVCSNITQLLTTALNIPSTKVCISKLK